VRPSDLLLPTTTMPRNISEGRGASYQTAQPSDTERREFGGNSLTAVLLEN
jgi:hypothetical protein